MAKWRIFNVMQYEKHPETGETLLTEEQIRVALLSHRTVKRWAYICHDKDVYSALDEEQNSDHKAGEIKPRHWHIVLECGSNVEIGVVARWLGVAENFVETAKGAGAFLDCVQYLTHEQEKQQLLGKRLYADSEVKSNFEFRAELDKRAENRAKYNRDLNLKERIRMEVLLNGMTLRQVIDKYPYEFQQDFAYLERCRIRYISKIAPMPRRRINYYVEGSGGIGKGLISRALARALIDRDNLLKDDEIFFEVGADRTSFEGYDGQPVLIWNDCRAPKGVVLSSVRRVLITASCSSLTLPFVKNAFPYSVAMIRAFCALKELSFTVKVSTPTVVTVVSRVVEKTLKVVSRRTASRLSMSPPETALST